MDNQDFKYKSTFNVPIKVVYAQEQGDFISLASLKEIESLAPASAEIKSNYDLLYNVFNAAVINRINKNNDGIDATTALAIYKNFEHKPMNIEHNRKLVVGHIIKAGFSEYKTNRVLTEEEVKDSTNPFYLSLSAVVYKLVDAELAGLLVEAADETSPHYQAISTSWEIGFNSYNILLGHKDLSEGKLITDEKDVEAYSKFLKCYGGTGHLEDGTPVYRMITGGNVLPLGCGYTMNPAADVKGVHIMNSNLENLANVHVQDNAVNVNQEVAIVDNPENIENSVEINEQIAASTVNNENISQNIQNNENISSQLKNNNVNQIRIMTINDIADANVRDFLNSEIDKASKDFAQKLDKVEADLKTKADEAVSLKDQISALNDQLTKVQAELDVEKQTRLNEKVAADFQVRMTDLNEKYNLSPKDGEVIAKQIRGLGDEAYAEWLKDWEVLAEQKSKAYKPTDTSVASADDILDNVVVNPANVINNPSTVSDLKKNFAEHFKVENFFGKK